MRRGKYVDVRIWSYADLGTCRNRDLFITDVNMNILSDFEVKTMLLDYDDMGRASDLLALANEGLVEPRVEQQILERIEKQTIAIDANVTEKTVTAAAPSDWDSML